jgi:hypothetical protein
MIGKSRLTRFAITAFLAAVLSDGRYHFNLFEGLSLTRSEGCPAELDLRFGQLFARRQEQSLPARPNESALAFIQRRRPKSEVEGP